MTSERCGNPRCGRELRDGEHLTRGWCTRCYDRWRAAGKPEGLPPPPQQRGEAYARIAAAAKDGRIAEAARLNALGVPHDTIALRLAVQKVTVRKYLRAAVTRGIPMPSDALSAGADLMYGPSGAGQQPSGPAEKPEPTHWNGRALEPEEIPVIAAALEASRRQAAQMLPARRSA